MKKEFYLSSCICVLMALLTLSTTAYAPWIRQVFFADQGWHLAIGQWMGQALVPYKDIFEMKGLFYFFIQMVGMKLAGPQGVWSLEVILLSLGYINLYRYSRMYLSEFWALMSVFICMLLFRPLNYAGDTTESMAFFFVVSGAYYLQFALIGNESLSNIRLCAISACFVLLMHIKLNYCCYICILGLFLLIKLIRERQYHVLWKYLLVFICSFVFFNLPFFLYLYYNEAMEAFFDVYLTYGFEYSGVVSLLDKLNNFVYVMWGWLHPGLLFIPLFVSLLSYKCWTTKKEVLILFVSFAFSLVFTVGLSGYDYEHYRITVVWQLAFFIIIFCQLLCGINRWGKWIALSYILFLSIPAFYNWLDYYNTEVKVESNEVRYPRELAEKINFILPDDSNILMIGCPPSTYYWCGKPLAVKYGAFQKMIFKARPKAEIDFYNQICEGKCDAILCTYDNYVVLNEKIDVSAYRCKEIESGYILMY